MKLLLLALTSFLLISCDSKVKTEHNRSTSEVDSSEDSPKPKYIHAPSINFATYTNNLRGSLLNEFVLASSVQQSSQINFPVCVEKASDLAPHKNNEMVLPWMEEAFNKWNQQLIGQTGWQVDKITAYKINVNLSGKCPLTDGRLRVYVVRLSNMNGGNNTWSGGRTMHMNLGNWAISPVVILHEVGHQIGLADTYFWDNHKPIDQPDAIMNNAWDHDGKLQRDDIDGIRFVWKVLDKRNNGEVCPYGYKKGGYEGKLIWGETFCIIDHSVDPNDMHDDNNSRDDDLLADNNQYCASWAQRGECSRNSAYMLPNCALSCSLVGNDSNNNNNSNGYNDSNNNSNLVDNNQYCAAWAERGECSLNPAYMLPNCALSCSQVDNNSNNNDNTELKVIGILSRGGKGAWGEGKNKAFDGRIDTKWLDDSRSTWIEVKYNKRFKLTSYKITSANDVMSRDPKNWVLTGSNGSSWFELDRRTDVYFSHRNQTKTFYVNSNQSFNEYRLQIISNRGHQMTQLSEIEYLD